MAQHYTEGAQRALDQAARLAEADGSFEIQPAHLLLALLLDDSLAAEILSTHNVPVEQVKQLLADSAKQNNAQSPLPADLPAYSPEMRDVLNVARSHSTETDTPQQIGTEELLWGLVTIESSARRLLEQFGLTSRTLPERLSSGTARATEPLPVDFELKKGPSQEDLDRVGLLRMLDAAANRAREGLRVVEDFVRFVLNDTHLTERLKRLRHELAEALRCIEYDRLLTARETQQDVGTGISTATEQHRTGTLDVVRLNFKRLQEALRTLEECTKQTSQLSQALSSSGAAAELLRLPARLERLRYEAYTLEKAVLNTERAKNKLTDCRLYLLVTAELCEVGLERVVKEAAAGGVSIIQLREKRLSDRELAALARKVRKWTRDSGVLFMVNDRPDIAVLAEADGVHVGQDDLSVYEARRIVGADLLVGVSTHSLEQARQAVLDGADYIGVGPVFTSKTKQFESLAGLEFVRQVAAEISLPWFAIGGIEFENLEQVCEAGATRVAVCSAVCRAARPEEVARRLLEKLKRCGHTGDR